MASAEVGDPTGRASGGTDIYLAPGRYRATLTAFPDVAWLPTPVPQFACTATMKLALKATLHQMIWEMRVSHDPATDARGTPVRSRDFEVETGALYMVWFAYGCPATFTIDKLP